MPTRSDRGDTSRSVKNWAAPDPFPPFLAPYYATENPAGRQGIRFWRVGLEVEIDSLHIPLRVLIVEDSEDKATLEVLELYRGGFYPFFELVSTPEAMETALRSCQWDLVVSGDYLKQIDAAEALMILRGSGQNTPFVVVAESLGAEAARVLTRFGARVVWTGEWDLLSPVVRREFLRIGQGLLLGDSLALRLSMPKSGEIRNSWNWSRHQETVSHLARRSMKEMPSNCTRSSLCDTQPSRRPTLRRTSPNLGSERIPSYIGKTLR